MTDYIAVLLAQQEEQEQGEAPELETGPLTVWLEENTRPAEAAAARRGVEQDEAGACAGPGAVIGYRFAPEAPVGGSGGRRSVRGASVWGGGLETAGGGVTGGEGGGRVGGGYGGRRRPRIRPRRPRGGTPADGHRIGERSSGQTASRPLGRWRRREKRGSGRRNRPGRSTPQNTGAGQGRPGSTVWCAGAWSGSGAAERRGGW